MFDANLCKGVDIGITYCGHKLQSPFILSSGPLSYGAEGMIKAHRAGCGAVVTKTIRLSPAVNPAHHIGAVGRDSMINCEKWADFDRAQWCEKEIPDAVKAGVIVIASVGHTEEEAAEIVRDAERAGAHMIELVSYEEKTMLPMLDYAKKNVSIPVICKLSGNWPSASDSARKCLEHGADGICAVDSIGPVLKIDIKHARPQMMSADGYGWMTGGAMRPISMRINSEIARNHPGFTNLYSSGGCMEEDDAIEFMMAGATGVGVCTVGILKGIGHIETMCYKLSERILQLGYRSIEELRGAALANFPKQEALTALDFGFTAYDEKGKKLCVSCGKCENVCSYGARKLKFPDMTVDMDKCRSCGLCLDLCPTGALTAELRR